MSLQDRWTLYTGEVELFCESKENELWRYQKQHFEIIQWIKELKSIKIFTFLNRPQLSVRQQWSCKTYNNIEHSQAKNCDNRRYSRNFGSKYCYHFVLRLSNMSFWLMTTITCGRIQLLWAWKKASLRCAFIHVSNSEQFWACHVKTTQHRMRPEISDVLMPYFYNGLVNHGSIHDFESAKGLTKNLFFLHPEKQEANITSRHNEFEAQMLIGLCKYLLQQSCTEPQVQYV